MGQPITGWWARATPLKNMISSIGMIISNIWENKKWQPNHQPDSDVGDGDDHWATGQKIVNMML